MQELTLTVAQPFKKRGKDVLTTSEFVFALSLDLKWFSPDQTKMILHSAEQAGLLVREDDYVKPNFDLKSVEVPFDFRPSDNVLVQEPLLDKIVARISDVAKKERKEVVGLLNRQHERLSGLVEIEVSALMVAIDLGVGVDDLIGEAWEMLTTSN